MLHALLCAGLLAADPLPPAGPLPPPAACLAPSCCTVESAVKQVPRTVYATKDAEYCLTGRSLLLTLLGRCDDAIQCSPVRVKRQLVKKVVTDEKCETKCVPKPAAK